jgi:molybdenum cofactor cytidylyltransferase
MDCVIPSAGFSRRMGEDKLLLPLGGERLVAAALRHAVSAGTRPILVLAPGSRIPEALGDLGVLGAPAIAVNPDPGRGMLSSIKAGLLLVESEAFFVAPADMPFLSPESFAAVAKAAKGAGPVFPRFRGELGHPVLIPASLRQEILGLPPEAKLRNFLLGKAPTFVEVDDDGILFDVDTREEYERALRREARLRG